MSVTNMFRVPDQAINGRYLTIEEGRLPNTLILQVDAVDSRDGTRSTARLVLSKADWERLGEMTSGYLPDRFSWTGKQQDSTDENWEPSTDDD